MENWSDTKKECYRDFIDQMKKDGYIMKPRKKSKPSPDYKVEVFEEIRSLYPRTTARPPALKAWNSLKPNEFTIEKIIDHLECAYVGTDKEFIPHFSTYLNQHKWEDEVIKSAPKLLKVPLAQDQAGIDALVRKYNLPLAGPSVANYFEYRDILVKHIEKNKILPLEE